MKVIFYLADSLSSAAIANPQKKINKFNNIILKNNFINKLCKNSIYFNNCYSYGDTFSSTTPMMTGENPYKNYADAAFLNCSFKTNNKLSFFFKKKGFFNIYYSNLEAQSKILNNEYERYYSFATQNYDLSIIKKKNKNYNFKDFFYDNNLKDINYKYDNIFYFFHECSLHSDPNIIKNCDAPTYLNGVNKLSNIFEKQLKLINYNKNIDIIYFLSDHGILFDPFNEIYFNNNIKKKTYNNYYKKSLEDEKIKFIFFIVNPNQKKVIINNYTSAMNVLYYVKKNFLNQNKKKLFSRINNKYLIVSIKSGAKNPYLNFFDKLCFHNHFIYISKNNKIVFNRKQPELFLDLIKKKIITDKGMISKKMILYIKNYYNFNKITKKVFFFLTTIFFKIKNKLIPTNQV